MELKVSRDFKGQDYTIGKLYINGVYFCDTLEDTDRGLNQSQSLQEVQSKKVYGKTAIPAGRYTVDMNTVSPKFSNKTWATPYNGVVPRIMNVTGFDGVLIHPGNKPEDTLGCLLVGQNKVKGQVINSVNTYNELMNKMLSSSKAGEPVYLEIG